MSKPRTRPPSPVPAETCLPATAAPELVAARVVVLTAAAPVADACRELLMLEPVAAALEAAAVNEDLAELSELDAEGPRVELATGAV